MSPTATVRKRICGVRLPCFCASSSAYQPAIFTLQILTDLINWMSVCTKTVLKGSAQFVDPNTDGTAKLYYRIVPADAPPAY